MFDQLQFLRKTPILRNKLLIALALVCALGFGSTGIANAQCGGGGMKMSKHSRSHRSARHSRKHGRSHSKARAHAHG
jgi:hypothetical protein